MWNIRDYRAPTSEIQEGRNKYKRTMGGGLKWSLTLPEHIILTGGGIDYIHDRKKGKERKKKALQARLDRGIKTTKINIQ